MKIAVLGAGITGISSALELAQDGHSVSVFERASAAASGASFAPTGLISPALITPWSLPHWPAGSGIRWRGLPHWSTLRWLHAWGHKLPTQATPFHFGAYQQLLAWSQARMQATALHQRLEFERAEGSLLVATSEAEFKRLQPGLAALKGLGVGFKELSPEQARLVEPGLGSHAKLHTAVQFPGDEVINCRQFAMLLRDAAAAQGVQFHFNAEVQRLQAGQQPSVQVQGWSAQPAFDALVLCTGAELLPAGAPAKLGLALKVVQGHTLSALLREPLHAPRSAVVLSDSGVVLSRQGMRVRVSGGAFIGKPSALRQQRAYQALFQALNHYFPGGANLVQGTQQWSGARAFSRDGLPLVGASGLPGVWLNLAHGANGWALSGGSARILADQIAGRASELDTQALLPARLTA